MRLHIVPTLPAMTTQILGKLKCHYFQNFHFNQTYLNIFLHFSDCHSKKKLYFPLELRAIRILIPTSLENSLYSSGHVHPLYFSVVRITVKTIILHFNSEEIAQSRWTNKISLLNTANQKKPC